MVCRISAGTGRKVYTVVDAQPWRSRPVHPPVAHAGSAGTVASRREDPLAGLTRVIVIDMAVGMTLPIAAENVASRVDASEQARVVGPRGECPALNQVVQLGMTIDELHDLQDGLCPTLSEAQRAPASAARAWPVRASHNVAVPSQSPVNMRPPSRLVAICHEPPTWDRYRELRKRAPRRLKEGSM